MRTGVAKTGAYRGAINQNGQRARDFGDRRRYIWRYTCTITSAWLVTGDVDPRVTVSSRALGGDRSIVRLLARSLQGYRKHTDTLRSRFDSSWESDLDGL